MEKLNQPRDHYVIYDLKQCMWQYVTVDLKNGNKEKNLYKYVIIDNVMLKDFDRRKGNTSHNIFQISKVWFKWLDLYLFRA